MNGVTRSLCTFEDLRTEDRLERCRRLRLTLHDQNQQHNSKPIGRAFALVQPSSDRPSVREEPAKAADEKVEVIKVYLKAREQQQAKHQQNLKMLSEEVSQIQEVRYSLKNLREQMAAKNNSYRTEMVLKWFSSPPQDWADDQERTRMREVSKRLYAQLQEAEKKHQEEREKMQAEAGQYRQQLAEQNDQLKKAEVNAEKHTQEIAELQRLLNGMEQESSALREQLMKREAQLMQLRERKEEREDEEMRSEELQKENAILKEKLHHLDDMLRSQQRKLRTMIEQVQNSKLVIQERDRVIRELEERVAFLEAENREMHDQMDYFLGGQRTNSYLSADPNARIVYR
uniref:Uncharacterized protein n=1 Tax=Denticeps clupeoides TaxID=299321 RepID=A0AAY4ALZ2_9TELE